MSAAFQTSSDTPDQSADDHQCFYRALVDGALDIIIAVNDGGTIVFTSPSAKRQLGYGCNELIGSSLFDLVHPDDVEPVREAFDTTLRLGTTSPPLEHRLRHKTGTWASVESVTCFRRGAWRGLGVIHARDIATRKLLEEQLNQSQRMEAIGLSTTAIAHDFNNLLLVLGGYINLLEGDPSETIRGCASEMRLATDRARELAAELLAFVRPAAPATDRSCDANVVVFDFQSILERLVGPNVRVSYALGASTPRVKLGRVALEQILINLAVNARQAIRDRGEVRVATSNERRPVAGAHPSSAQTVDHVHIAVSDNGVGIPKEIQSRVFEPFFTTKGSAEGTGIGLLTVFRLVQQARGTVDVVSVPGLGTTFHVFLPVDGADASPRLGE